jgi:hypothetical protein
MSNIINVVVDKNDIGLSNVDNTSDLDKEISIATQNALDLKEDIINKSTDVLLGSSDELYPSQNAVKSYVDNAVAGASTLQLGETSTTAYRGDRGKIAYDHSQTAGNPHNTSKSDIGLANVPNIDATNPANIIQDSTYRFVTDSEKSTWNSKENAIASGTTSQYFRGDKTFQTLDKSAVGLENSDNTSDLDKPISTATQNALNSKADLVGGKIPSSQIPATAISEFCGALANESAMISPSLVTIDGNPPYIGDWCIRNDVNYGYVLTAMPHTIASNWTKIITPSSPVDSVNGYIGVVVLDKNDVGLDNVPNVDATNPANISQSASYRFVTDTEKSTWNGKQDALGFTPENISNKSTSVVSDSASDTKYPSVKSVYDWCVSTFTTASAVASQITTALSGYATQTWVNSQGFITNVITSLGYTPANKSGETFTGSISATNLSGTNTGDETTSTIKTKLGVASASNDGYLSSANWSTFNNKISGSGTINKISKFNSSNNLIDSQIQDDGNQISIGSAIDITSKLKVFSDGYESYSNFNYKVADFPGLPYPVYGTYGKAFNFDSIAIGGKFEAEGGSVRCSVQLIDGTEASGKVLGCVSSDGFANWKTISELINLTTIGSSGSATLVGNTLNIPIYTSGGGGSQTLEQTLALGNTAGIYNINLNNNDLQNVDNTTTNTLNINSVIQGTSHKNLGLDNTGRVVQIGNSSQETFVYSFANASDNFDFFNDGFVKFGWDAPGNDLEFYMLTEPAGNTDIRALATFNYGTQQNTFVTTPNLLYDLYGVGVPAGSQLNVFIVAEVDLTYPIYQVELFNASSNVTIKITKTKKI